MNIHKDYLSTMVTNTRKAGTDCNCSWLQFSSHDGHTAWRLLRHPEEDCHWSHEDTNPENMEPIVPEQGAYGLAGFPDLKG